MSTSSRQKSIMSAFLLGSLFQQLHHINHCQKYDCDGGGPPKVVTSSGIEVAGTTFTLHSQRGDKT